MLIPVKVAGPAGDQSPCLDLQTRPEAIPLREMLLNWRLALLGALSWLIPFVAAIPFFDHTGVLVIEQTLFKSLMVVIGGASGVVLLALAFRRTPPTMASGAVLGAYWMAMNLILGAVVLMPMSGMSVSLYLSDIGLRYLLLPIMGAAMGAVADRAAHRA